MPIYPYVCTACGHEFDALQKLSDAPLTDCPECAEATLRKRLAAPAFQLKGTGWYETDFKHGGKSKQAGGDNSADKTSGGSQNGDQKSKSQGEASSGDAAKTGGDSKPAAAAGGKDD